MSDKVVQLIHQRERAHGRDGGTSAGGGGNGMEARIARLEAGVDYTKSEVVELRRDMRDVREKLGKLEVVFGKLEERVSHLPSKGFIVAVVTTGLAIIVAITTLAPKLQALVGITP